MTPPTQTYFSSSQSFLHPILHFLPTFPSSQPSLHPTLPFIPTFLLYPTNPSPQATLHPNLPFISTLISSQPTLHPDPPLISAYTKHIQSIHEGLKCVCDQCDFQATRQRNIQSHVQLKHNGIQSF